MNNKEAIEQLESLLYFMREKEDGGSDDIWKKDVEAIEKAIEALEVASLE